MKLARLKFLPVSTDSRRAGQLEELEAEVAAHLPVLPVLREQLRETVNQVEQSVVRVCTSFQSMADRARQSVSQASRLVGEVSGDSEGELNGGDLNMEALLEISRSTMHSLLDHLMRGSKLTLEAVERMSDVEGAMKQIFKALAEVDQVSFGNTILALNAQIEAAHVGERGKGFEIVAREIWNQARKSNEITERIRGIMQNLRGNVEVALGGLRETASADLAEVRAGKQDLEKALAGLEVSHQKMRGSVSESAEQANELAGQISEAIVSLQFQDRVSQRVGHVVEALERLEQDVGAPLNKLAASRPRAIRSRQEEIAEQLKSTYTMARERSVLSEALGQEAVAVEEPGNDIELF